MDKKFVRLLANNPSGYNTNTGVHANNHWWQASVKTWKLLDEMKEIEQFDTDKAWDKLYARFEKDELLEHNASRELQVNYTKKWYAIAASIIILLSLFTTWMILSNESWLNKTTYTNNALSPRKITLPDGSWVYLNYQSKIVCSKSFGNKNRNIKLYGEAFFDVQRNENLPFQISLKNAQVTVLGTSFNVYQHDDNVEVIVKSGTVKFTDADLSNTLILEKNERGLLENGQMHKTINHKENYLAWLNKQLVFKQVPLIDAINDINHAFHAEIILADTSLNQLLITTNFTQNNLHEVVAAVALAFNLEIQQKGKKYILAPN